MAKTIKRYYGDVDMVSNKLLNCLNALIAGGATGQALIKTNGTDFSVEWGGPFAATTSGTWNPIDASGAGLTFTVTYANYTKIGNMVFLDAMLTFPATANGSNIVIGGLPFESSKYSVGSMVPITSLEAVPRTTMATTTMILVKPVNTACVNSEFSGKPVIFSIAYRV